MSRTPRMGVSAEEKERLLAEASDPTTPPERLAELSHAQDIFVAEAAQSNPNLDDETLETHLWRGAPAAWSSPATPLWLLTHEASDGRIVAGANIFVFTRLRHGDSLKVPNASNDPVQVALQHAFGVLRDWWQRPGESEAPAKIAYLATVAQTLNDDELHQQLNRLLVTFVRDASAASAEVAEALAETLATVEDWSRVSLHNYTNGVWVEPQTPRQTENLMWKVIGRLRDEGVDDGEARLDALLRTTFPTWRAPR